MPTDAITALVARYQTAGQMPTLAEARGDLTRLPLQIRAAAARGLLGKGLIDCWTALSLAAFGLPPTTPNKPQAASRRAAPSPSQMSDPVVRRGGAASDPTARRRSSISGRRRTSPGEACPGWGRPPEASPSRTAARSRTQSSRP